MPESYIIEIFDEIDNDLLKRISATTCDLEDDAEVTLKISSYGGAILDGIAIIDLLKRFRTHAMVVGYACSAAAIIALSCDKVTVTENASLLLHSAWAEACDSEDVGIKRCNEVQLSIINKRCPSYTTEMLKSDVWISAERALELGLADNILGDDACVSKVINYAALCTKYAAKLSNFIKSKENLSMEEVDVKKVLEEVKEDENVTEEESPVVEEPQHDLIEIVEKLVERVNELEGRLKALEEPEVPAPAMDGEGDEDACRIKNLYNSLCQPKSQIAVACANTKQTIQKVRKDFEKYTRI